MSDKTHWKKYKDKEFLGEWDLKDDDQLELTIIRVEEKRVQAKQGADKKSVPVLFFKEVKKGLILNATNGKMVEKILKSPYVENWIGKKIIIFKQQNVNTPSGKQPALRVSSTLPKPKQSEKVELTPEHSMWESAIEAMKAKKPITVITDRYILSEENKKTLLEYGI
ncbi:MAG: hypothetical protein S4CHLAM20_04360 [Chlamydiia bacterium]|nr:hypothetical protein [Chlamydiia bacterium]